MKKLLFLLPLLFLIMTPQVQYASDSSGSAMMQSQSTSVDYTLAYPGLLPDNPLYFMKVIRDRLVGFFISDPLKVSAFDLLQADKRLNAGVYLAKEQKVNEGLIVSTISKGENYFSESINQLELAKQQGEVIDSQLDTLRTAGQKHIEVLRNLQHQISPTAKAALEGSIKRIQGFQKMVTTLTKQ